ncbi:hypothetical protein MKX01_011116, partial [Papaver californicum]
VVMKKGEAERDLEEGNNQVEKNRKNEKDDLNHIGIETDDDDDDEEEEMKKFDEVNMLQTLNLTNPLRIVIQGASQVHIPPPSTDHRHQTQSRHVPPPHPHPHPNTPPQQNGRDDNVASERDDVASERDDVSLRANIILSPTIATLNSKTYTNRISLFIFLVHMVAVIGLEGYLGYIAIEGIIKPGEIQRKEGKILKYWLPQVEGAAILSIILAFTWQKAMRTWPSLTLKLILWCSFFTSLAAGIVLLVFQKPSTDGVGVALIAFAIGNGLYACWVSQRIRFTAEVLERSLEPVCKFRDLNQPTCWMLGLGFIYITLWVSHLAWTAEVLRNVANITVSRVIALYYLRGVQCSTGFCFQRALSTNLGSACLGSLFVPAIEALRIISKGLNLLEGEDESFMDSIFRYGNSWAFVQIAAYGKDFVKESQDTWRLFERIDNMEQVVDADITSSVCFLTGACSGFICVIVTASWTFTVHKDYTATVSVLAFFLGYLLTRIGMALPHACVSCSYACYAENP